jgi:sphingomyelin phosphodiesterase acid-like 3
MKNLKKPFITLVFGVLVFSFTCYSQSVNKTGLVKKCLIVSDIHFDPLWGTPNDTALKRKLINASLIEWQKSFENSKTQTVLDASLLGKDANYAVLRSALVNMKKKLPHPAFIIIAGDFIWHNATPADSVLKRKTIQFIAGLFKTSFPGVTIIPAMGNNDTYGDDYALQDQRFLNDFAGAWAPNIPKSSAAALKAQGYYTWKTGSLKLLVINSASLSYGSLYQPQAAAMLNWVESNLADAQSKNVWIISHIPPGLNGYNDSNMWNADYTQTFVNTVVKYAPNVKLELASHTHFNDFKVFYNAAQLPVAFMRIVPSICSNHGNNPSFEIAEYNNVTCRVIHETNWYLNLVASPIHKSIPDVVWTTSLNLPADLEPGRITAHNFSKFINEVKNDKTNRALKSYVNFYNVGTKMDSSKTINRGNVGNYLKADSLKGN